MFFLNSLVPTNTLNSGCSGIKTGIFGRKNARKTRASNGRHREDKYKCRQIGEINYYYTTLKSIVKALPKILFSDFDAQEMKSSTVFADSAKPILSMLSSTSLDSTMPTTVPRMSTIGPPLLPPLTAALVIRKVPAPQLEMLIPVCDTVPVVMLLLLPSPSGLPMSATASPRFV